MSSDFYQGLLSPLLPIFAIQHGWSMAQAGILITAMHLTSNFSQTIFAIMADHKPKKSYIWIGLIIAGLPFCFVMKIANLQVMVFAMIISGLGVGMFHPVSAVAANSTAHKNHKGISMALFASGGNMGLFMAPIAAVLIVEVLGKSYMPLIILPAIVIALYFAFEKSIVLPESHRLSFHDWFSSFLSSGRELLLLCIISTFSGITLLIISTFLPMLAMYRGASYAEGVFLLSASIITSILGMFAGGYISDIYGHKRVLSASMIISTPILFAFLYTSGIISVVLLLLGIATLCVTIPLTIILAQRANPKLAGMASSFVMGIPFAIGAIAATPFGMLSDYIGIGAAMNVPLSLPIFGGILVFFINDNEVNT